MLRNQVTEFHVAMGVPVNTTPRELTRDRLELRLKLIAEEFLELVEAAGYCFYGGNIAGVSLEPWDAAPFDMEEFADALGDLDYVIEGCRLECGIDGAPIAAEIHAANMRKTDGPVREDGKKLKPPGWAGPDIRARLIEQGWTPPAKIR